jgi:SPP1 gp7 family putative phage head morphogenesis protein
VRGERLCVRQPDADAIAALRAKSTGEAFAFDWRDFSPEEHAAAFVVAKAMRADILAVIRAAVDEAVGSGMTPGEFGRRLEPLLVAKGWWGRQEMTDPVTGERRIVQLGSQARLRIIFDTNMRMAHAAGRWQRYEAQAATFPFLRYVAVLDERTRESHARWHGTVLPVGHAWWDTHYPPNGWRCRCRVMQVSRGLLEREGWSQTSARELAAVTGEPGEAVNRRTGQVERVWPGVDPGFAHNAGKVRMAVLEARARRPASDYVRATQTELPFLPPLPPVPDVPKLPAGVTLVLDDEVLESGLLDSRDAAIRATAALLAGKPDGLAVTARWADDDGYVNFRAYADGFELQRVFKPGDAGWAVKHEWFEVDRRYQQGGLAKRMLLGALPFYDSADVVRIEVQAALSQGAYVWARAGFAPDQPALVRRQLLERARELLRDEDLKVALSVIVAAADDEVVWRLAGLRRSGRNLGHLVLAGWNWYGHLDLGNPAHRRRLMDYLEGNG